MRADAKQGTRQMKNFLLILLMITSFSSVAKELSSKGETESKTSSADRLIFFRNCMNVAEATPNTKPIPETDREKWIAFCGTLYVSNPYLAGSCRSEQSQIGVQKQNWCRNSKF